MFSLLRRLIGSRPLKITLAGATHPGGHRDHNEDAYSVSAESCTAVIADGMGGLSRGEVASQMVVAVVNELLAKGSTASAGLLEAHKRIREASMANGGSERMGSTAVVLSINQTTARLNWIGDSRAYLWRDKTLKQITKDHSFVEELIDAGAISASEAETHPNRNVLTRAVGIRDTPDIKADETTVELQSGDHILMCTDGLHGYLPRDVIVDCLAQGGSAQDVVDRLIKHTLSDTEAGDNVTVICAVVGA
ncbi:MAG TPA: protein phosphatase 2C domain-containing protein [Fontimonas sp.]